MGFKLHHKFFASNEEISVNKLSKKKKIRYLILSESDEPPLAFSFRDSDSERESEYDYKLVSTLLPMNYKLSSNVSYSNEVERMELS